MKKVKHTLTDEELMGMREKAKTDLRNLLKRMPDQIEKGFVTYEDAAAQAAVVDPGDVRVLEARGHLDLALESSEGSV